MLIEIIVSDLAVNVTCWGKVNQVLSFRKNGNIFVCSEIVLFTSSMRCYNKMFIVRGNTIFLCRKKMFSLRENVLKEIVERGWWPSNDLCNYVKLYSLNKYCETFLTGWTSYFWEKKQKNGGTREVLFLKMQFVTSYCLMFVL